MPANDRQALSQDAETSTEPRPTRAWGSRQGLAIIEAQFAVHDVMSVADAAPAPSGSDARCGPPDAYCASNELGYVGAYGRGNFGRWRGT